MLGSSDLLRKKICVTVFLDELFEELEEDSHENSARECREVDSKVKIEEESPSEQINMFTCESGARDEYGRNDRPKSRPRKPRQQSKFGNSKNNLRTGCSCCGGWRNESNDSEKFDAKSKTSLDKCSISTLVTKISESVMTDESFLSGNVITGQKIDKEVDCTSKVLVFTKSTQFDSPYVEIKKKEVLLESKGQQTEKEEGVNTQLDDVHRSKHDGDLEVKLFDLKFLLEDYVRMEERLKVRISEDLTKQDVLFEGSSSEQISNLSPQEVIRVWSTCRKVWSENFESEMSEVEFHPDANKVFKQCSVALNLDVNSTVELDKTTNHIKQFLSSVSSDTKCSRSCRKTAERKQEIVSPILEVTGAEETHPLEQTKFRIIVEPPNKQFECRSKNFAEGDTFEELCSNYIFRFESKENLIVCNKVLSQEANEVMISKAKVQFINSEIPDAVSQQFAEVFVKKKNGSSDTESEMIFAESLMDADNSQEVLVFEFEDAISKTKFLKRMKTVEIFGDASINDIKNISTELILICEDVNKEICVEAWEGSPKNLSGVKDSKESTMYLIEIPLHFVKANRKGSMIDPE